MQNLQNIRKLIELFRKTVSKICHLFYAYVTLQTFALLERRVLFAKKPKKQKQQRKKNHHNNNRFRNQMLKTIWAFSVQSCLIFLIPTLCRSVETLLSDCFFSLLMVFVFIFVPL